MKQKPSHNDDQKIMHYLNREMSESERHAFESEQLTDPFANDAMEGLSEISGSRIEDLKKELDARLKQQLQKKKRKKRVNPFTSQFVFYVALGLIILLAIMAYFIIRKM